MRLERVVVIGLLVVTVGSAAAAQVDDSTLGEVVVASAEPEGATRDPGELFVTANTAYDRGDYPTAIDAYRQLIDLRGADGQLHFNLGNAYLRNGELGRAIAELRRGRSLLPRDEDIRANLAFARESTKDAIAPPAASPVLETLVFWHYRLSRSELATVVLVVNILFWSVALSRIFFPESEILRWLLIVLLVGLVATSTSLATHRFLSQPVAVILPQEIDAFTAPDTESVVRFKLHAGTELRVKDEREGWLRIILPDDQQGWIEAVWTDVVEG